MPDRPHSASAFSICTCKGQQIAVDTIVRTDCLLCPLGSTRMTVSGLAEAQHVTQALSVHVRLALFVSSLIKQSHNDTLSSVGLRINSPLIERQKTSGTNSAYHQTSILFVSFLLPFSCTGHHCRLLSSYASLPFYSFFPTTASH